MPIDPCLAAASLPLQAKHSTGYHEMIVQRLTPTGNFSGCM